MSKHYNDALVADLHRATNSQTWTAEKNSELYAIVAAGDKTARETMINGNMPLVLSKVEAFIRCFPHVSHLRDDLVSAGFIGLLKAVNQMAEGCKIKQPENWNPTDCIGAWINRELGRLVESESPIRVPHTSKKRAEMEGNEVIPPTVCNVVPEQFENASYEAELEIRDLINTCCFTEAEKTYFAMREQGHTLTEIADALGVQTHSVTNLRRKLQARIRATIQQDGQLPKLRKKAPRKRGAQRRDNATYYRAHREKLLSRANSRYQESQG